MKGVSALSCDTSHQTPGHQMAVAIHKARGELRAGEENVVKKAQFNPIATSLFREHATHSN